MILINQATVNMTINIKVNMTVNMEVEMTFNTIDTKVNMIGIIKNLADTKTVGTNLKITDMMEEVASMEKDRMIIMVVVSIVRDKINTKEIIERIEIIDNLLKDNLDIINKKGMSRAGMKEEMIRPEILPETIEIIIEMINMRRNRATMTIMREEEIEMEQERVLEKEEIHIKNIRIRKKTFPITSFNLFSMNDYKFINSYYYFLMN